MCGEANVMGIITRMLVMAILSTFDVETKSSIRATGSEHGPACTQQDVCAKLSISGH